MRVNEAGWLEGEGVERHSTPRTGSLDVPTPRGIVWHWTAGKGGPGFAEALAKEISTYERGVDRPASWHLLIAKDGTVHQSAPFKVGTWHVGRPGTIGGLAFTNVNRATVGVELENAGRLLRVGERFYCWPYTRGGHPDPKCEVAASRAVAYGDQFFDAFTAEQERSAGEVLAALVAAYHWPEEECVHGHCDFDPARKEDPGPVWTKIHLPRILSLIAF